MRQSELDILTYAAELLSGAPWNWRATVEYPGFLLVTFTEDVRSYAAGFANPTLTVDQHDQSGAVTGHGVDTKVPCGRPPCQP